MNYPFIYTLYYLLVLSVILPFPSVVKKRLAESLFVKVPPLIVMFPLPAA